jgi:hypothetical protein
MNLRKYQRILSWRILHWYVSLYSITFANQTNIAMNFLNDD